MPLAARTNRGSTFTKRNKMNSKKFLDQLGLIALISKIKQALNGKQNVDMVVTITQSGNAYSCDTSIANIVAAHDAGRDVYAVLPPVSDGSSTKIKLVEVQNYGSGTVMMVSFGGIINYGTNNVLYSVSGTRQNNLDAWSVSQKTMQEKLVSGTNIKTVSGVTLLGSGDLQLNGEHVLYYGGKPKYNDFPIDDCIDDLDSQIEALGTPNEIASITTQESSASGGNNVVTITDTDGTVTTFNVKNGKDGQNGADGVSLGEIALVQTTGDSEESVMSQRAVTAEVTRASMLEIEGSVKSAIADGYDFPYDLYYRLDWLSNENGDAYILTDFYPKDNTVRFTGAFAKIQATTTSTSASIISSYKNNYKNFSLWLSGSALDSVGVLYSNQRNSTTIALQDSSVDVWHTFDLSLGQLILDGEKIVLTTPTAGTPNNTPMRILDTSTKIRLKELCVYESDVLVGRFIPCKRKSDDKIGMWDSISGNFYAPTPNIALTGDSLTNSKLLDEGHYAKLMSQDLGDDESKMMSQAAITRELVVASSTWNTFTHVGGCLCYFNIADYPDFDIRECEGVSIVVDNDCGAYGGYTNNWRFLLANNNSASSTNPLFGFSQGYGIMYGGILRATNAIHNGLATDIIMSVYSHLVLTFDFKSGVFSVYKNGVLYESKTPASYDYDSVMSIIRAMTHIGVFTPTGLTRNQYTTSGYAVFGHALSASEVTEIFDSGSESTRGNILPEEYYSYQLKPVIITTWTLSSFRATYFTTSRDTDDGGVICTIKEGYSQIRFAFGISSVPERFSGRCKREFDFTVLEGTVTYNHTQYSGNTYKNSATITDSGGNVVTFDTLGAGTYHFSCIPTIIQYPKGDTQLQVEHVFDVSEGASMWIHINYKVTDLGAALVCSKYNYRGAYWLQKNGYKIPVRTETTYGLMACHTYNDTYKPDTVIYNSSVSPQFNGQIAVDTEAGKVYIGYLTGTGGTWKQVSN